MTLTDILVIVATPVAFAAGFYFKRIAVALFGEPTPKDWEERARYAVVSEKFSQDTQGKRTVSERRL